MGSNFVYPVDIPRELNNWYHWLGTLHLSCLSGMSNLRTYSQNLFCVDSIMGFETEKKAYKLLDDITSKMNLYQLLYIGHNYSVLLNASG